VIDRTQDADAALLSCGSRRRATAPGGWTGSRRGRFHPAPEGVSDVRLTAAVDPAKYPILIVTAESGDGDPRPSRDVVLRSGG
jgi:hypothetical protein